MQFLKTLEGGITLDKVSPYTGGIWFLGGNGVDTVVMVSFEGGGGSDGVI